MMIIVPGFRWYLMLPAAALLIAAVGFFGGFSMRGFHASTRGFSLAEQPTTQASVSYHLYIANKLLARKVVSSYQIDKNRTTDLPDRVAQLVNLWRIKSPTVESCKLDVGVLAALASLSPDNSYMFVASLKDSDAIIPHFAHQLLTAAQLLQGSVYISLHESSSSEATDATIAELKEALSLLRIPNSLAWGGKVQRRREPGEEHTTFLARLRNAALAPVYSSSRGKLPHALIFLDDVLFCANDILRLVLLDADLACGLDFSHATETHLHDIWVLRDVAGSHTAHMPHPYLRHPPSAQRLRQGLPTPVHCCWNGLAVARAKPFEQGLRVRSAHAGECRASECSLLCDDMHRMGYRDVLVDPSVRVAYNAEAFKLIHSERKPPLYFPYDVGREAAGLQACCRGELHAE